MSIEELSAQTVSEISESFFGADIVIHLLWLDERRTLAIVHDADIAGKDINFFIETIIPSVPVQAIAGDVVFARFQPSPSSSAKDEPVLEDIQPQDVDDIAELLSDDTQVGLTFSYFLHGG